MTFMIPEADPTIKKGLTGMEKRNSMPGEPVISGRNGTGSAGLRDPSGQNDSKSAGTVMKI